MSSLAEEQEVLVKTIMFMCCTKTVDQIKNYSESGKHFDREGFLVCPEHGERRWGWKTPRKTYYPSVPQNLDKPPEFVLRYNFTESPLERDKAIRGELGL